jgi:hypothetical protein
MQIKVKSAIKVKLTEYKKKEKKRNKPESFWPKILAKPVQFRQMLSAVQGKFYICYRAVQNVFYFQFRIAFIHFSAWCEPNSNLLKYKAINCPLHHWDL